MNTDVFGGDKTVRAIDGPVPPVRIEPFEHSDDITFFEGEFFGRTS